MYNALDYKDIHDAAEQHIKYLKSKKNKKINPQRSGRYYYYHDPQLNEHKQKIDA